MNEDLATAIEIIFKTDDLGEDIHPADINRLRDAYDKAIRRRLTDEIIADLWYKHGAFHHHFARAIDRYLKGEQ